MKLIVGLKQIFFAAIPVIAYILILLFVFGKNLAPANNQYLFGWDTQDIQYFTRVFFRDRILSGTIPWWNPFLAGGQPFMASADGPIFLYPGTWLFYCYQY